MEETTESVGTPLPLIEDGGSLFDGVGQFGGIGALGGAGILLAMILLNWKMSGKKKIKLRNQEVQQVKNEIAHEISANDEKFATLQAVLHQNEKLSTEKQKQIETIVDNASTQIQEALKETDINVTVKRITQNWKGGGN